MRGRGRRRFGRPGRHHLGISSPQQNAILGNGIEWNGMMMPPPMEWHHRIHHQFSEGILEGMGGMKVDRGRFSITP